MLELAGRIRFGVDVRDLLQLQRTFHRDGPHRPAPQEQRVLLLGEILGQQFDALVHLERLLDGGRGVVQMGHELGLALRGHAVMAAEHQGYEQQREQLRGKRLRAGHTDLGAGLRHHHEVALAHHGAVCAVAHRERGEVAQRFRHAQRFERVGGLARLR